MDFPAKTKLTAWEQEMSEQRNIQHRPHQAQCLVTFAVAIQLCCTVFGQDRATFEPPADVEYRTAWIISEGTRMSAEIFATKGATDTLPTIVMSHGWGGTAEDLRPDGVAFARAGFLIVTFDYRGWGKSDARVIAKSPPVQREGKLVAEVTEVRGVVDPIDQTTDILNAISWVHGEEACDPNRIGIWGSSFSGGHVVYVTARDPRVKAFVSQVGSMDGRWAIQNPDLRKLTFDQASKRTRGEIGYPEPFAKFGGMTGQPVWEKLMRYAPIEDIDRCDDCAKLFIIAENEELFDNKDHAIAAHNRANGVKKLVTVKGIKHYGIYTEKRKEAQQLAIDWFRKHLHAEPHAN
ncbi:MAG: dienelactone hydrolase [Planctomycetaceae bacterium]